MTPPPVNDLQNEPEPPSIFLSPPMLMMYWSRMPLYVCLSCELCRCAFVVGVENMSMYVCAYRCVGVCVRVCWSLLREQDKGTIGLAGEPHTSQYSVPLSLRPFKRTYSFSAFNISSSHCFLPHPSSPTGPFKQHNIGESGLLVEYTC